MKNETLKTIIHKQAPQQTVRPAEAFWSECRQRAQQKNEAAPLAFPSPFSRKIKSLYPALASFASVAALVILYFSLHTTPEIPRTVDRFELGKTLAYNGAVVLNDPITDATILWVMTNDIEEETL